MNNSFKPIALDEKSYNVKLLHKALAALGLPVTMDEAAQGKAGKDTVTKVRALQAKLNVPVDDALLVDEATALAMATAMRERGLSAASRSFTVSGTARHNDGSVAKRQRLLAFDLDLRGVAVYRTIQTGAEIEQNGGFEFLEEAVSDPLGNYRITFYDWQYGQAERKKADVVVYAFAGDAIIGRSRLVNTEDYSAKGLARHLDVVVTPRDTGTEYAALMSALNAFLKESEAEGKQRSTLSLAKVPQDLQTGQAMRDPHDHRGRRMAARLAGRQEERSGERVELPIETMTRRHG